MALSGSLTFISASLTGSENIKVDFAGLNTLIVDPITGSYNELGYSVAEVPDSIGYYNTEIENIGDVAQPNQLNSLLAHRNGAYQYPMWKQWRGYNHPVARKLRLNNTMSIDASRGLSDARFNRDKGVRYRLRYGDDFDLNTGFVLDTTKTPPDPGHGKNDKPGFQYFHNPAHITKYDSRPFNWPELTHFYEPPVISKFKPILYEYENYIVKQTLTNEIHYFSNTRLNTLSYIHATPGSSSVHGKTYKSKLYYYQVYTAARALPGATHLLYSETIFPTEINAYKTYKLRRPTYEETPGYGPGNYDYAKNRTFWKNTQGGGQFVSAAGNQSTRMRTPNTALNSVGIPQTAEFLENFDTDSFRSEVFAASGSLSYRVPPKAHYRGLFGYNNNYATASLQITGAIGHLTVPPDWPTAQKIDAYLIITGGLETNNYGAPLDHSASHAARRYMPIAGTSACHGGCDANYLRALGYTVDDDVVGFNEGNALATAQALSASVSRFQGGRLSCSIDVVAAADDVTITFHQIWGGSQFNGLEIFASNEAKSGSAGKAWRGTDPVPRSPGRDVPNRLPFNGGMGATYDSWNRGAVSGGAWSDALTGNYPYIPNQGSDMAFNTAIGLPLVKFDRKYSTSISDRDILTNGHRIYYINNGIVSNPIVNTTASTKDVDGIPQRNQGVVVGTTDYHGLGHPFTQLNAYQPFSLAALSSWPLDARDDIFNSTIATSNTTLTQEGINPLDVLSLGVDGWTGKDFEPVDMVSSPIEKYIFQTSTLTKTHYLTSSVGGRGLMIGLSPHTLTSSFVNDLVNTGEYGPGSTDVFVGHIRTGHVTRSVGELVYSTKPTIFFYRRHGQEENLNIEGGMGYLHPTASMQYMRHTYPYQCAFFATDRIVGRAPFFDSYHEFIEKDLEALGRDYSIVPEFRMSDHLDTYATFIQTFKNMSAIGQSPMDAPGQVHLAKDMANYAVVATLDSPSTPADNSYISDDRTWYRVLAPVRNVHVSNKSNFLSLLGADVTSSGYSANSHHYDNEGAYQGYNDTIHEWNPLSGTVATTRTDEPIAADWTLGDLYNKTYKVDPISVEFYEKYSHMDKPSNLAGFLHVAKIPADRPGVDAVSFNIKAIQKLLPYSGFYPVTRTTQVGTDFATAFTLNLESHHFVNHRFARQDGADKFVPDTIPAGGYTPGTYADYGLYNGVIGQSKADPFNAVPLGQMDPSELSTGPYTYGINSVAIQTRRREIKLRAQLQSILEPLMAPGILYNSIKSGMAVDYPIYTVPPKFFAPLAFTGSAVTQSFDYGGGYMLGAARAFPAILTSQPNVRMPFEALYKFDQLKSTFKSPSAYSDPAVKTTSNSKYTTFRSNYLVPDFVDYDLVPSSSMYHRAATADTPIIDGQGRMHNLHGLTASYAFTPNAGIADDLSYDYKMDIYYGAINNFLAETMNFYLADVDVKIPGVKLPILVSEPNKSAVTLDGTSLSFSGLEKKEYAMGVTLTMGPEQILCEGPRNSGLAKRTVEYDKWVTASDTTQSIAPTRYQQTSSIRGYIFGPPIEIVHHEHGETNFVDPTEPGSVVNDDGTIIQNRIRWDDYSSYFAANLQDPAYQAFTPPYFYGDSTVIFRFNNTGFDTFGAIAEDAFTETANISDVRNRALGGGITGSYSFERYNDIGAESVLGLCTSIPSTSSVSVGSANRMKVKSCVDLFTATPATIYISKDGIDHVTEYEFWHVSMKWMSPVLNFFHSSSYFRPTIPQVEASYVPFGAAQQKFIEQPGPSTDFTASNPWHDETTGRGLWGGYGTCPYDGTLEECLYPPEFIQGAIDDGIYLKFHEVKMLSSDENVEQAGSYEDQVIGFGNTGLESNNGYYGALDLFLGDVTATGKVAGDKQFLVGGSMIKDLGLFKERDFEVGRISSKKTISEAIVIIPYFETPIVLRPRLDLGYEDALDEEIYTTREIIPGKHFLPIHKKTFSHIFSTVAVNTYDYYPNARAGFLGGEIFKNQKSLQGGGAEASPNPVIGSNSQSNYNQVVNQTDCGRMISTLLGTSPFFDKSMTDLWQTGYQLPPEFDFINNAAVDPFQMIVVPFVEKLRKQDLINIYQNVMPDCSLRAVHARAQQTVNPGAASIKNDRVFPNMRIEQDTIYKTFLLSDIDNGNFLRPYSLLSSSPSTKTLIDDVNKVDPGWGSKKFYKNLKFMVFKIKQRAIKNYDKYKQRQILTMIKERMGEVNDQIRDPDFDDALLHSLQRDEIYGPNWPYDYFSLVEAIKVDIEIKWEDIL